MKLRTQLLLAGAITLALPVAAFNTVQQMDNALRESRSFELQKSVDTLGSLLRHSRVLPSIVSNMENTPADLYAERIQHRIVLDGYGDDWNNQTLPARRFEFNPSNFSSLAHVSDKPAGLSVRLAVSERYLHLLVDITDDKVIYHQPRLPPVGSEFTVDVIQPVQEELAAGDHFILYNRISGKLQQTVFSAIAPGPLKGRQIR